MKHLLTIFVLLALPLVSFSNAVAIVDGGSGVYFKLNESDVGVEVNNQIALVTTTQTFTNNTNSDTQLKFGFPLNNSANAISLRWQVGGVWKAAEINASTQDSTIPGSGGGGAVFDLLTYLGNTALYFSPNDTIKMDSTITFELVYVELLPYAFNVVNFYYPNDYSLISSDFVDRQSFSLNLNSDRTIDNIELLDLIGSTNNTGNVATISYELYEEAATSNYRVDYELSSTELGVFDLSTLLPDSLVNCDTLGNGFVSLIIEPESNVNTEVIQKNFSLIIDRSGSMVGDKIVQAREAATFIVNNLNEGDFFNVIDFSSAVNSFSPSHVEYTPTTQLDALNYISGIYASGGTNISESLTTAINQFQVADPDKANILIFFTDGQATFGTTSTSGILSEVEAAVNNAETTIFLYTFGIGENVNQPLLTSLALENNGIVEFLGNDEVETVITEFFLTINNPVLLSPIITFTPNIIEAIYPSPLPNLYKGRQLIISGRYEEAQTVSVNLSGNAFNIPVSYDYTINLADSNVVAHSFLPKIWAKQKMDALTLAYYLSDPDSPEAEAIEAEIDSVSLCYSVISNEFTSFNDGTTTEIEDFIVNEDEERVNLTLSPNPFTDQVAFTFNSLRPLSEPIEIYVYNEMGQLITILRGAFTGTDTETIIWGAGSELASGFYFCKIKIGNSWNGVKLIKH